MQDKEAADILESFRQELVGQWSKPSGSGGGAAGPGAAADPKATALPAATRRRVLLEIQVSPSAAAGGSGGAASADVAMVSASHSIDAMDIDPPEHSAAAAAAPSAASPRPVQVSLRVAEGADSWQDDCGEAEASSALIGTQKMAPGSYIAEISLYGKDWIVGEYRSAAVAAQVKT